jgi:integrase
MRIGPFTMTWSLKFRVSGEGGISKRGRKKKGKTHRVTLGEYPAVTLEAARSTANDYIDQAKRGINPAKALEAVASADGLTVRQLGALFIDEYVKSRELRSIAKYQGAIDAHINFYVGDKLADLLTREDVRDVVKKSREQRAYQGNTRARIKGGTEAARTVLSVLRQMIGWGIDEEKLKRKDNPASNMEKNLPKKKKGERCLSLRERREAWRAAGDLGYPFGPVYQLNLLTGDRRGEWGKCKREYIDLEQALLVLPAVSYKSDHVHVVPLVPAAVEILKWVLTYHPRSSGPYIFSGTDGERPLAGWSKAQVRMKDAIFANTGAFPKPWTPHAMRRGVATDVAERTGESGDKLVKRVLGHTERGATSIYNQYPYLKELRKVLTDMASEILATETMHYVCPDSRFALANSGDTPLPQAASA